MGTVDEIKVRRLDPRAKLPTRGTRGSVGWDLYALEDVDVWSGECRVIRTGVALQLPPGYEAQIRPRSSLSSKGILCSFGTIDTDYKGEVGVVLTNLLQHGRYTVKAGDRVGQLVFQRVPEVVVVDAETNERQLSFSWAERGAGGFGSTGR